MFILGRSKKPIHPKHLYDLNRNTRCSDILNELPKNSFFLDLGSGTGSELLLSSSLGIRSVGLEYSESNIEISLARLNSLIADVYKHNLEASPLPFENNSVDFVNFSNVLEHLNNRKFVLNEISRVLNCRGLCLISVPNSETAWKRFQRFAFVDSRDDIDHKIEYSFDDLCAEISSANLVLDHDSVEPIIPSFPFNGLIAFSAVLSPSLYRILQAWKRSLVVRFPSQTIGWSFLVYPSQC